MSQINLVGEKIQTIEKINRQNDQTKKYQRKTKPCRFSPSRTLRFWHRNYIFLLPSPLLFLWLLSLSLPTKTQMKEKIRIKQIKNNETRRKMRERSDDPKIKAKNPKRIYKISNSLKNRDFSRQIFLQTCGKFWREAQQVRSGFVIFFEISEISENSKKWSVLRY